MRRAVICIPAEMLRSGLGPIADAGLSVFGSFDSWEQPGRIVLGIEGDALPERCEPGLDPIREVSITLSVETYGEQRLVRVTTISLTGRNVFDLSPDARRRAA